MEKVEEVIKKLNGKYFVYSHDGKKKLGGPYASRAQAVKRLRQVEHFKHKESLSWDVQEFNTKIIEEGDSKWLKVTGTAITTGTSRNGRTYTIQNLKENDGNHFNWIVGHRSDYDNPDHNIGEGTYNLNENKLLFDSRVKNTKSHPDIVEQFIDGLVAPSVQGGARKIIAKKVGEATEYIVEGLRIPLLAAVNKHTRGVEGATAEAVIAEAAELDGSERESNEKEDEGGNMSEDEVKEYEEKIKKLEEKLALKDKEHLVESILSINSKMDKDKLMEKNEGELKIVKEYEQKIKEQEEEAKPEEENKEEEKPAEEAEPEKKEEEEEKSEEEKEVEGEEKSEEESEALKGIVIDETTGDISMSESRYKQFNKEVMESTYKP